MAYPSIIQAGFERPTSSYDYRPLTRKVTIQKGWDVFALQTMFLELGYKLPQFGADGYLGDETATVIWKFQHDLAIIEDGIAGIQTQQCGLRRLAAIYTDLYSLPIGLVHGQLEKECGFQVGNFVGPYGNETYDIGCTQRNAIWSTENCRGSFQVGTALRFLCGDKYRGLRPRYLKYYGLPGATSKRRAWELAAGSWHAPSYTDKASARSDSYLPSYVEAYIDRVTTYVDWSSV